jgi:hypothetical protein
MLTEGKIALVDDEDYERINSRKWLVMKCANGNGYKARGWINGKMTLMHRFILSVSEASVVHHINHDTLDNQKVNLRVCTSQQNTWHRLCRPHSLSRFKGVDHRRPYKSWRAQIKVSGKIYSLGSYPNEIQAAKAYDEAAAFYFGEYASLNFPRIEERLCRAIESDGPKEEM